MTDFLSRMVERAMGQASVVQPLVVPMFAPGPIMAASHHDEKNDDIIEQDYTSFAAESEPVVNPGKQVATKPETLAARPIEEGNTSPAASEPRVTSIGKSGEKVYSQIAASDSSEIIPAIVPKQSESNITPPLHNSHDTFTIASHFVQRRGKQLSNDLLMEEQSVSSGFTEKKHKAEEFEISGRTASSASSPEGIRPQIVVRREQPVTRISEKKIPNPDVAPSTPTIKVSIGRIEVRGITQQPAPAKHYTPPAPKVSLDEYLKKQSEGKR